MGTPQEFAVEDYLCGKSQWETEENVELYRAATEGDYERLKHALDNGANANYWSKSGDMLGTLHAAARSAAHTDALCTKELIDNGAKVSAALITNRNKPIHEAANAGSEEVCRVLIEASPKCTESENAFGNTALHAATRACSADVVSLLLERGADCNRQNHRGSTALHIACFLASREDTPTDTVDPYLKIGAILLRDGALQIDIKDVNGYTPLHIASQRGCNEMVKLLIDNGASLTEKTGIDSRGRGGRTPLGMAIFGGHDSTSKILKDVMGKRLARKLTVG